MRLETPSSAADGSKGKKRGRDPMLPGQYQWKDGKLVSVTPEERAADSMKRPASEKAKGPEITPRQAAELALHKDIALTADSLERASLHLKKVTENKGVIGILPGQDFHETVKQARESAEDWVRHEYGELSALKLARAKLSDAGSLEEARKQLEADEAQIAGKLRAKVAEIDRAREGGGAEAVKTLSDERAKLGMMLETHASARQKLEKLG